MKTVILCSPYRPDCDPDSIEYVNILARNLNYVRACVSDSIFNHKEAPFASHLLYTQILDDKIPAQRALGLEAEHSWFQGAHTVVMYIDLGISEGMLKAERLAGCMGMRVEKRIIKGWENV